MRKLHLIPLFICIGLFQMKATAQVQLITTVPITVPTVLDLSLTSGSLNTFNFNTTSLIDLGITLSSATTLTYKSNQAWHVTIAAASANFTSASATPMPASVIQYRLHGSGSYTALSATAVSLLGTTGSPVTRGTGTIVLDFFLNPGYSYAPATDYTMTIKYTITNP